LEPILNDGALSEFSLGMAMSNRSIAGSERSRKGKLHVGTSGWTYADWKGRFYPEDVPKKSRLEWYASQFNTTEINGSFYRTPSIDAVQAWAASTPRDFLFAWKASKYITHWKRLGPSSQNSIELLESRLELLGSKCGPVLFQLPARFQADNMRLTAFLAMLSPKHRYAFEFRHRSWYDDSTFSLLSDHDIALCISDHHDAPSQWIATARHVYVRGHGPTGQYKGRYSVPILTKWSRKIAEWQREGRTVYVYFDNDQKSAAPFDARKIVEVMEGASRT
jgi:uncharacterized protein YecE (DUF72 family)